MRLLALVLTLLLADFAVACAQTATPDTENGRYSLYTVAGGVLRLDTRTGQISQCSRSDVGWVCKVVPDERSVLENRPPAGRERAATLKKELLARGLPVPGALGPSVAKPDEPEFKLPSDTEVDKVISFLDKVWRRLVEMGRSLQKEIERKIDDLGAALSASPTNITPKHDATVTSGRGVVDLAKRLVGGGSGAPRSS